MKKRSRKEATRKKVSTTSCHQCRRSREDVRVIHCGKCQKQRYCVECIRHWYPHESEAMIAVVCPFCRGNCNCTSCLRNAKQIKVPFLQYVRRNGGMTAAVL
ncbi:lysine-specific demethylase JMJ29-like isoform X2 [Wolffia australiana]